MPQFLINSKDIDSNMIIIDDKENYNHIAKSLRVRIGEDLLLIDENEIQYETKVEGITKNYVRVSIENSYKSKRKLDYDLYIAISPLNSNAINTIFEKLTELGVRGFYPIYTDIIVRFIGKCTVEMIKSLVEHANVKPPVANGFGLYVKNNCYCDNCGESLSLVKANKHFMRCKKCGRTQALTVQMVNRYLDSTGGRCPRCGRDMYAVNGQFGIYVKCSENHIAKLDEI